MSRNRVNPLNRRVQVVMTLPQHLVNRIEACDSKEPRSRVIESLIKMGFNYRDDRDNYERKYIKEDENAEHD